MKKIVLLLVGAVSVVVGGSAVGTLTAAAQSALTLSPSTVMAGTNFQAMLSGCSAGEMNRPGSGGGSGYWIPTPMGSVCWAA